MHHCTRSLRLAPALALGTLLFTQPASAQFVCIDAANSAQGATATGSTSNMACGRAADGSSGDIFSNNTAIGDRANASSPTSYAFNTAVGAASNASGDNSENAALGYNSFASGDLSANIALGTGAGAGGDSSHNIALGSGAIANGDSNSNIAIGTSAQTSGLSGSRSIAIGSFSSALGDNAVAVGTSAVASHSNSAAFGNGATTTRADQQMFGTSSNTYTMAGIASAASQAAQGTPTHLVTSNASGDLAAYTFSELGIASSSEIAGINSGLAGVNARLNSVDQKSDKALQGVAMAFAMAGTPALLPSETFALSGNWGGYEGKSGVSIGAALRLQQNVQLDGGVAYGVNDSTVGGRAGVRVGW